MTSSGRPGAYATPGADVDSNVSDKESSASPGKHIDLRVQRTRESIDTAFREMVCEMPANQITVTALTKRARIHRKTFYLHYSSIEALFEEALVTLAQQYFEEIDAIDESMSVEDINRVFFRHAVQKGQFYERLLNAPDYRAFASRLFSLTLQHNRQRTNPYAHLPAAEQNIVNTFLVSATLEMYRQWIADGREIPLRRMIELSSMLLSDGASAVRRDL